MIPANASRLKIVELKNEIAKRFFASSWFSASGIATSSFKQANERHIVNNDTYIANSEKKIGS